ncbi:MAG: xanthomonadin biosynthesis protein [Rhodanobacteraceae bacterium]
MLPVSASVSPPTAASPPRRSRLLVAALIAYVSIVAAAVITGRAWLDELAAFLLVTLVLSPGIRRRSMLAGVLWILAAAGIAALALGGHGEIALDFTPVMVNVALCVLFAHTLAAGHEPLIARLIAAIEGPSRLALPRVADYARRLTFAWALLLGAQALFLTFLIVCGVPDGLLARLGLHAPFEVTGEAWRWYLHVGSYAVVLVFMVLEYAVRRWHLRHIPHPSLPTFLIALVRRWPELARSFIDDAPPRSAA